MNIADELDKLQKLRDAGTLSEEEFLKAKEGLLNAPPPSPGFNLNLSGTPEQQSRQWALILHLSQLAGYVVPVAGMIVPIVIWQMKKDEFPIIDVHGKIVVNWLISSLIYIAVGFVLTFVLVGFLILPVIAILGVIYPIIGGMKANNGEVWEYPGSIKFI
jgi:hypothetical protein